MISVSKGLVFGFIILAGVVGYIVGWFMTRMNGNPKEPFDGVIGIEGKAIVMRLDIPIQELIIRKKVALKVDIPDGEELLNSREIQD